MGLYLNLPQNALVLSVDENPSIQALERARGYVQTSSSKIVQGMKGTYKRHGTVNLFAALDVATGVTRDKTTQTKKRGLPGLHGRGGRRPIRRQANPRHP